ALAQQNQFGISRFGAALRPVPKKLAINPANFFVVILTSGHDDDSGCSLQVLQGVEFAENRFKDGPRDPRFLPIGQREDRDLGYRTGSHDAALRLATQPRKNPVAIEDCAKRLENKPAPTPTADAAHYQQNFDALGK